MNRKYITIPNLLSFYRIIAFPFILAFALQGFETLFVIFLLVNLFTDILDGIVARAFNQQTEFGARLDSLADLGTYFLAITGVIVFKASDFAPHLLSFGVFMVLFVLANVLSLFKFRRFPSLHLYSWKIGGYIQGIFFFVLFLFGFHAGFYYFMISWGILAFLEHIIIQLIVPEMRSNQKGLYWVLKNK
ncbi:MAG: CDP-alcohol phosphatidyltransferase family protein [Bacteroidetes bacterium]|nr:MAG: CDP-alcohol phosphatidyltransferase family protein [Bacteroidota bacterium]